MKVASIAATQKGSEKKKIGEIFLAATYKLPAWWSPLLHLLTYITMLSGPFATCVMQAKLSKDLSARLSILKFLLSECNLEAH